MMRTVLAALLVMSVAIFAQAAEVELEDKGGINRCEGKEKSEDAIEKVSDRTEVQILIYPVITMGPTGHSGSRVNLLGKEKADDRELIELLSNEKHVNAQTPPAFLVHGIDDSAVPVSN